MIDERAQQDHAGSPAISLNGHPMVRIADVHKRYGDLEVLKGINLDVASGEVVCIIGASGSGKTTLLRALLGQLPLVSGERWLGPGVVVGELDQGRQRFLGDQPLVDAFGQASGLLVQPSRSLLAKFGLAAEHVARPASSLSPGERTRATLALLMATGANCLVLDEPTNHLDLPAIEQLEQALESFEGTLLLVTHDRALLDNVRIDRVLLVGKGNVTEGTSPALADPR